MKKRMFSIAAALLLLGSLAGPALANEVTIFGEVESLSGHFDVDSYEARCTQQAHWMCLSLDNLSANGQIHVTAVMTAPAAMYGKAWSYLVFPDVPHGHCFSPASGSALMKAYVTVSNEASGSEEYRLRVQCFAPSGRFGFSTRGTAVTTKQDQ